MLSVLFAAGALSISAASQQAPGGAAQPAARVVEVDKLKDNLYVMRGGGGNSAVFITPTGVVVVDTKNPGWGQPLLDKIKSVTDQPVTMIAREALGELRARHLDGDIAIEARVARAIDLAHADRADNLIGAYLGARGE